MSLLSLWQLVLHITMLQQETKWHTCISTKEQDVLFQVYCWHSLVTSYNELFTYLDNNLITYKIYSGMSMQNYILTYLFSCISARRWWAKGRCLLDPPFFSMWGGLFSPYGKPFLRLTLHPYKNLCGRPCSQVELE